MLLAPFQGSRDSSRAEVTNYGALLSLVLQVADLAVVVMVGVAAHWIRFGSLADIAATRKMVVGTLVAALVFGTSSLYRNWRTLGLVAEALRVMRLWTVAFGATLAIAVALKFANDISRIFWALWYSGGLVGLVALRVLCHHVGARLRRAGIDVRTAVVIGGTQLAERIIETFHREQWAGIEVRGWFTATGPCMHGAEQIASHSSPCLGAIDEVAAYVEHNHIHEVWLALPFSEQSKIDQIISSLRHSTADIKLVPDLFGLRLLNQSIGEVAGLPVISLRSGPMNANARLVKAIEDRVLALLIVLGISPLLALIAVCVKVSSPGPILFRQRRHGRDGEEIEVWKFRSMRVHQEPGGQITQAMRHDSRVTPLGALLRRTSLDELPQFFNVLQGTMSIVGPRPHAIAHNHQFKEIVQDYMQRHRMKPGITGWAQINGYRGETDTLEKMEKRVEYDLSYMQNWSLRLDLRIMLMTLARGFVNKNAY